MKPDIRPQHEWLQQLMGSWTCVGEATMEAGKPPVHWTYAENVRSLDKTWVLCEGSGEMPEGGRSVNLMTLGYDPARGRYVGSFVGSAMTHLWVYDGEVVGDRRLDLYADGPDFEHPGRTVKYRDTIEIVDRDHRTLTSHLQGEDGQWQLIMTVRYTRAG